MESVIPDGITKDQLWKRIQGAVDLAQDEGMEDGSHHKQSVITSMLKKLLGDKYREWLESYNADPEYPDWDEGIPA